MNPVQLLFRCCKSFSSKSPTTSFFAELLAALNSLYFLRCSLYDFFYAATLDGGMPPSVIGVSHVLVESTKVPPV